MTVLKMAFTFVSNIDGSLLRERSRKFKEMEIINKELSGLVVEHRILKREVLGSSSTRDAKSK